METEISFWIEGSRATQDVALRAPVGKVHALSGVAAKVLMEALWLGTPCAARSLLHDRAVSI